MTEALTVPARIETANRSVPVLLDRPDIGRGDDERAQCWPWRQSQRTACGLNPDARQVFGPSSPGCRSTSAPSTPTSSGPLNTSLTNCRLPDWSRAARRRVLRPRRSEERPRPARQRSLPPEAAGSLSQKRRYSRRPELRTCATSLPDEVWPIEEFTYL